MQEVLSLLFNRLRQDERQAMPALYAQTSAHLNGIALRILPNARVSSSVLKTVFVTIWEHRHSARFQTDDILSELRAMTHRAAIEYKLTQQLVKPMSNETTDRSHAPLDSKPSIASLNLTSEELDILSSAYLDAMSLGSLAEKFGMDTKTMKHRIDHICSSFTGGLA